MEEREHQYNELQSKFSEAGQKHNKDLENVGVQVAQLEAQVKFYVIPLFSHFVCINVAVKLVVSMYNRSESLQEVAAGFVSKNKWLVDNE